MGLLAKDKGGIDPIPAGMYQSVCYGVIDLGVQPSGNPKFRPRRQVCFLWEVPSERLDLERDGEMKNLPRVVSRSFSLSLASKGNLRPMLESWRGRPFTDKELEGFDLKSVLGANCFLNIIHEKSGDKTYANVSAVNPLPKNTARLNAESDLLYFSFDDVQGPVTPPAALPEWIKAKIMLSDEYLERMQQDGLPPQGRDDDASHIGDDIPF